VTKTRRVYKPRIVGGKVMMPAAPTRQAEEGGPGRIAAIARQQFCALRE
jgi:hypothetical protein